MNITTAQLKAKRAGKPLPRKEGEIQSAILAYLRTVPGVVAWRTNTGAVQTGTRFVRFGFRGMSDIIGWRTMECWRADVIPKWVTRNAAVFIAIEVKAPGKPPTREQVAFIEAVRSAGGLAFVAHSVDDVVSALGLTRTGSAAVAAP